MLGHQQRGGHDQQEETHLQRIAKQGGEAHTHQGSHGGDSGKRQAVLQSHPLLPPGQQRPDQGYRAYGGE